MVRQLIKQHLGGRRAGKKKQLLYTFSKDVLPTSDGKIMPDHTIRLSHFITMTDSFVDLTISKVKTAENMNRFAIIGPPRFRYRLHEVSDEQPTAA